MDAVISGAVLAEITAAARAAYPDECCGLLLGACPAAGSWRIDEAVAAQNIARKPHHDRFEVDPSLHLRLQRELRGSGRGVIGHYHSHPNGRAEPSAVDLAAAQDPGLLWLIIAVADGGTEVGVYGLSGNGFAPVALAVDEGTIG